VQQKEEKRLGEEGLYKTKFVITSLKDYAKKQLWIYKQSGITNLAPKFVKPFIKTVTIFNDYMYVMRDSDHKLGRKNAGKKPSSSAKPI
jgi:hypothetical protein